MAKRKTPVRDLTREQLAAALGVAPKTIEAYVAAGLPHTKPQRTGRGHVSRFSEPEARAWMAANGRTARQGRPSAVRRAVMREAAEEPPAPIAPAAAAVPADDEAEDADGDAGGPPPDDLEELPQDLGTLSAAEIDRRTAIALLRKTHWQARQARALALETEGRLVDRDEVDRQRVDRIQAVRARHEVVPSRLAWKLVGKPKEEVERLLAEEMALIGDEFAKEPSE